MATRVLYVTKDSIIRPNPNRGSGKDPHNTAGLIGSELDQTLIDFEAIPAGITVLDWAKLWIKRSTGSPPTGHDTPDAGAQLIPGRITTDWSEGSAGADHLYSTSNAVKAPGPTVTGELSARGSQPSTAAWWFIYVNEIVQAWVDGSAQKGIRLRGATNADIVFDSLQGLAANKPYLELSYNSNQPPNKPTNPVVAVGPDGTSFTFTTTYTDPDGDTSPRYRVIYTPDPTQ